MSNIILNVAQDTNKVIGFTKNISIAEYFENNQLLPLRFLVPITNDSGDVLSNETINAELPIIGQLYQKNATLNDVKIVLITDNLNYQDEEVFLSKPKTLFEVMQENNEDLNSTGITSTSNPEIINLAVGDYTFELNTNETYTSLYKNETVKSFDHSKYEFDVIISEQYFDDNVYTAINFMDDGFYVNGEIKLISGVK